MTVSPEIPDPGPLVTAADSARYAADLADSLRKMALKHGQSLLAHLLHLAMIEARAQAEGYAQETRLPE